MKKRICLILFCIFFLSFSVFAQGEDFLKYNGLDMNIDINANIDLIPSGDNPRADFIMGELYLFPQVTETQSVSNINYNSNPNADIKVMDDKVVYKWVKPMTSISFSYKSNVKTSNNIPKVDKKIEFPLKNLDPDYVIYTEPTEYIDINSDIRKKAKELVSGEDDYYDALFNIADWVRTNIEYNLSTVTVEAVQKSSWVYKNREGVCDEITNLFISMARSVGIPARFVSGVAYTTQEESNWGNHGWAEVYFPGYGWVPFDVTYGQYGFVDPTHIILKESLDSSVASLIISSSANNLDFNAKGLSIKTELISKQGLNPELVRARLEPLENQVGPGSHVPVKISIENTKDFYIPIQFRVTKAPMIEESNIKMVILKPRESKDIFFLVKIPDNLDSGYVYKTVFEVVDSFGSTFTDQITYSEKFDTVSQEDAKKMIEDNTAIETSSEKTPETPNLNIFNLEYPSTVDYKNKVSIKFLLTSDAPAKNVKFFINGKEIYTKDTFDSDEEIVLNLDGKDLFKSDNFANLLIKYQDEKGNEYEVNKQFLVGFKNVSLFRRLLALFGV